MENNAFKDLFREYMEIKGASIKKVSDLSGVPERYIEALFDGDYSTLPPAPYVRGYISKLASILDYDKDEMWRVYKKEIELNSSGSADKLPSNRYAIKAFNKKYVITGAVALIVLVYFLWNFNKLFGAPTLEVIYPSSENVIVSQPLISIEGKTNPSNKLIVNGVEILVDEDGRFQKDLSLDIGLNTVTITARKFLGKEAQSVKKIIYQPEQINEQSLNEQKTSEDGN